MPLSHRRGQSKAARRKYRVFCPITILLTSALLLSVSLLLLAGTQTIHNAASKQAPASDAVALSGVNTAVLANAQQAKLKPDDSESAVSDSLVICSVSTPHSITEAVQGDLRITVRPDLAPQSAAAFLKLVESKYYDGVYIHRVVKNFVAQWGIHPNWEGDRPQKPPHPDPVLSNQSLSNTRGTLSFAGGNMRLGQVFINLGNSARLDGENGDDGSTRPFATLDDDSMALADRLYKGYKEGSGQVKAVKEGAETVAAKFPNMSRIDKCHIVSSAP